MFTVLIILYFYYYNTIVVFFNKTIRAIKLNFSSLLQKNSNNTYQRWKVINLYVKKLKCQVKCFPYKCRLLSAPKANNTNNKNNNNNNNNNRLLPTNHNYCGLLVVLHVLVRKRPPHIGASRFIYFFSLSTVFCPYSHSFIATCLSFASCSLPFVTVSYYSSHCSPSRQLIPHTSPSPGSLPPQHVI